MKHINIFQLGGDSHGHSCFSQIPQVARLVRIPKMVGKIPKNHKILIVFPFSEKIFATKKYYGRVQLNESRGLPITYIYILGAIFSFYMLALKLL
jgi:hypothetical protein